MIAAEEPIDPKRRTVMKITKIVSAVLCIALVVCTAFPAARAAEAECDCGYLPTIYVGPLGNTPITRDAGTDQEQQLFRLTSDTTVKLIVTLLPELALLAITRNYDRFGDRLIACVKDAMGDLALDGNGNSLPNVTTSVELPDNPEHGLNRDYYFHYDWRLDPMEVAAQLDAFVKHVERLTGHGKVNFRASSMGGVVTMAYFSLYGCDEVDACIFQCCPLQGTAVAGDLLSRKVKLNARALYNYGTQAYPPADFEGTLLTALFDMVYYSGLADAVMLFGGKLLDNIGDKLFDELLTPVFGSLLGLWSFVPDDTYELAKSKSLNPSTQAGLIAKADNYHYNVQCRAPEILNDAVANGVRVMIVAGYGMQRTPLVESMNSSSDATVDTKYASVGAVVAPLGETLGEGYVQARQDGHSHLSPDGAIDASTCALPEHTWFIKDMLHSNSHDGIREMYNWFTFADEYYDVWSDARFTQFLQNDKPNLRVIPMGNFAEGTHAPVYVSGDSYYNRFEKYVSPVRNAVLSVLDKIKG